MEQKINDCWVDLERMGPEKLLEWHNRCLETIENRHQDLRYIAVELAKRAMVEPEVPLGERPEYGRVKF